MRVRLADADKDAARVAEIYRPAVEASFISFEESAPHAAEMADRMRRVLARLPWLVAEDESGLVVGYAYASPHRERAAYLDAEEERDVRDEWQNDRAERADRYVDESDVDRPDDLLIHVWHVSPPRHIDYL